MRLPRCKVAFLAHGIVHLRHSFSAFDRLDPFHSIFSSKDEDRGAIGRDSGGGDGIMSTQG
jgi:hypothetical protein